MPKKDNSNTPDPDSKEGLGSISTKFRGLLNLRDRSLHAVETSETISGAHEGNKALGRGKYRNHTGEILYSIYSENAMQALTRTQIMPEGNAVTASLFQGAQNINMQDTVLNITQYGSE
jgi:hypothetical protein